METASLKVGIRKRGKTERWQPADSSDWDPSLPYGGKVLVARRKKPDTWFIIFLEVSSLSYDCTKVLALGTALGLAYYTYFHFERMHYHVARGYASFGFPEAQHVLGDKFYHGHGVEKDKHKAMEYYKMASDQGHPHSQYNLAVGHLKGIRKDLVEKGGAHHLIRQAAAKGVHQAKKVLTELCAHGHCDD